MLLGHFWYALKSKISNGSSRVESPVRAKILCHKKIRQTYVELSDVELEVALVEPYVVQAHVHAPGPGPGEALLLVLHHVDLGLGG